MDPTLRFQSWIRSRVSGWWATILSGVQVVDQWKFLHVWPLIFCILIVSFELEWVSNKIQPLDLPVIGRILQVGGEDKKIQTILHFCIHFILLFELENFFNSSEKLGYYLKFCRTHAMSTYKGEGILFLVDNNDLIFYTKITQYFYIIC